MDTENALTNAKESPNEIFFEEEARLWAEVYGKQSDKPDLESLQRMLENMNHLLLSLELPWERFIPILYRSFAPIISVRGREYHPAYLSESTLRFPKSDTNGAYYFSEAIPTPDWLS